MAEVLRNFRFGNTTWPSPPETITLSRDNLALFTADDRNGTSEEPALTSAWLGGQLRIPLYSVIFVLAVVGNSLVIVTLAQNRRMRTVTNVFLLNLSVSDLLLAVFCMPFTLIPTLLKDFIFGKVVCVFIRYLQGKMSSFFRIGVWININSNRLFHNRFTTFGIPKPTLFAQQITISFKIMQIIVLSQIELLGRGNHHRTCSKPFFTKHKYSEPRNISYKCHMLPPYFALVATIQAVATRLRIFNVYNQ